MSTSTQHVESGLGGESQQITDFAERKGAVNAAANSVEDVLGFLLPEEA